MHVFPGPKSRFSVLIFTADSVVCMYDVACNEKWDVSFTDTVDSVVETFIHRYTAKRHRIQLGF
jgi:hypothetical protein